MNYQRTQKLKKNLMARLTNTFARGLGKLFTGLSQPQRPRKKPMSGSKRCVKARIYGLWDIGGIQTFDCIEGEFNFSEQPWPGVYSNKDASIPTDRAQIVEKL